MKVCMCKRERERGGGEERGGREGEREGESSQGYLGSTESW